MGTEPKLSSEVKFVKGVFLKTIARGSIVSVKHKNRPQRAAKDPYRYFLSTLPMIIFEPKTPRLSRFSSSTTTPPAAAVRPPAGAG
jgi:hypothetical protein